MAQQHSDEENVTLLATSGADADAGPRRMRRAGVTGLALCGLSAVAWWARGTQVAQGPEVLVPPASSLRPQGKNDQLAAALVPEEAARRDEKRRRMVLEQDLQTVLGVHVAQAGRQAHFDGPTGEAQSCLERARRLFDEVIVESAMDQELEEEEFNVFRQRFITAMQDRCKDAISERLWIKAAGEELQQQKPILTKAIVEALNEANLGFRVEFHDWLLHESVATLPHSLGLLPIEDGDKEDVLKSPEEHGRSSEQLPEVFRAELKWPECKEEILRIHNQGHCGSCWVFGALASVDARMCIASGGKWNSAEETLSRLHVTSCASPFAAFGRDGCMGGFPHWAMEMMAGDGIASSSCLPYYIKGAGEEHFRQVEAAPPCETKCQGGYSIPLKDDTFRSAGIANYNRWRKVGWFTYKQEIMKQAIYTQGPVAYAFHASMPFMGYKSGVFSMCHYYSLANHAVYAFGWGVIAAVDGSEAVEYIESANSWGTNWGDHGFFRLHPSCVVEVTIPGPIESTVVGHRVGQVDSSVPRDKDNENWPWAPPKECPYTEKDGQVCVTDPSGPHEDYKNYEVCLSDRLNGLTLTVKRFDLERSYDTVTINGVAYSGNGKHGFEAKTDGADEEPQGWGGALNDIVVDDHGIRFHADQSKTATGFEICGQAR